nr:alpha/beta hydrolase-fold protein [Bowmanella dokdonensis]
MGRGDRSGRPGRSLSDDSGDAIDSWYLDSPVAEQSRYRTYIGTELVAHIDKHYRTVAEAKGRGITGLSMGGFGALHIGLNHPGQFGALASTAGGVDPRDYEGRWGLDKVLGDRRQNASFWDSMAIVNNLDKIKASGQALFIDCGLEDFFLTPNRQLHQALVKEQIPHHYLEMPGGHNWQYWAKSIEYQLVFFADFFAGHNP